MSLLNLREMTCLKLDQESFTIPELKSNQSFAVLFNLLQAKSYLVRDLRGYGKHGLPFQFICQYSPIQRKKGVVM